MSEKPTTNDSHSINTDFINISQPESIDLPGSGHQHALQKTIDSQRKWHKYARFFIAALGSIPWVGSLIAASATLQAELEQGKLNELLLEWVSGHEKRITELESTIHCITKRLDELGPDAQARAQSDNYLEIVGNAFRVWDATTSKTKRELLINLLMNAAGTSLCPDDLVRLFIKWIERYDDLHFKVISEIYRHPEITRNCIWKNIYGSFVREDSAEADLFRLLVFDLNTGRVIRQVRPVDEQGNFIRKRTGRQPRTTKSTFDDLEPYILTSLGEKFVHYAITNVSKRLIS